MPVSYTHLDVYKRQVIDTGYYIERYFPTQGVRFIAVNDRYDSSSPDHAHDGIIIPLRNMINEAYALDIAKKIKAQQRQAMKDGKYVGGRTPYGSVSYTHLDVYKRQV